MEYSLWRQVYRRSKVLYWGNRIYWNFNAICFSPERKASLFWILLTEGGWLLADVVVLQAKPDGILAL